MTRGFILLEAVIAMLIIAMVSLSALEAVQMINASVSRFSATAAAVQARRNGLALVRHLSRTDKVKGGTLSYGAFEVRWSAKTLDTMSYQLWTIAGPTHPITMKIHQVTVVTTRNARTVDQFDVLVSEQALFDPHAPSLPFTPFGLR